MAIVQATSNNEYDILASGGIDSITLIKQIIRQEDEKKYHVGKIITDTANVNPSTYLGFGTWELIDKEFAHKTEEISGSTTYANYRAIIIHNGHSIRIRIGFTLKETIGDGLVKLLDIGPWLGSKIGANTLHYGYFGKVGGSDSGDALVLYNFTDAGVIETVDTFTDNLNAGDIITVDHTWLQAFYSTSMLDSFCNKFYWKRTA